MVSGQATLLDDTDVDKKVYPFEESKNDMLAINAIPAIKAIPSFIVYVKTKPSSRLVSCLLFGVVRAVYSCVGEELIF